MTLDQEQEFKEYRDALPETFNELVLLEELSREPTQTEIAKMLPILRKKVETGDWGQTTQELALMLCSVTDITTTLEAP